MLRTLTAAALVAALAGLTGTAQDKKDPPKKKERIAIAEPTKAKEDPDFAIQGEYEGIVNQDGTDKKVGVQVVANGLGEFTLKLLAGGLPGAGWDGKTSKITKAVTKDGKVVFPVKASGPPVGTIADGVVTAPGEDGKPLTFKKVERKSPTIGAKPPEGAVVLFSKEGDEASWAGGRLMTLSDGKFLTPAKIDGKGGDIKSKEKFGAFKMHIEFRLPWMPNSTGQGRGNSGLYFQDRYECQVLDSFGLNGENNECGGIYTQHKPSVNMCLPPLTWQTYDIDFTPAAFDDAGKKTKNGRATILHNGVKIHDNIEFPKDCPGGQPEKADPGPFRLQDHGDPVIYRNVWVVPVK